MVKLVISEYKAIVLEDNSPAILFTNDYGCYLGIPSLSQLGAFIVKYGITQKDLVKAGQLKDIIYGILNQ